MKVNVISDSVLYPKGFGGMHSSFLNHVTLLKKQKISVEINSFNPADIVHIHTLGPLGLYHLVSGHHPKVVSAHVIPSTFSGTLVGDEIWGKLTVPLLRHYFNLADMVISVGHVAKKELRAIGVSKPITIIPNTVDNTIFRKNPILRKRMRKKYGFKENDIIILGAGQLQTRKGINTFFEVAKKLPRYKFVWVGGTFKYLTHQNKLVKKNIQERTENVILLDPVLYKEMPALYNMADICFFPSFQETSGLVIIEAAACGLPLVLRDLPEYKKLYTKGYLAGKNSLGFRTQIQKLVMDKKLYTDMILESSRLANMFSMENQKHVLLQSYNKLLHQYSPKTLNIISGN